MSKLQSVLSQAQPPGIYHFDSDASVKFLRDEASKVDWRLFVLDGRHIKDKRTFLEKIARPMSFPAYFGKNWDALNDCLTDMSWAPAEGYIVLFQAPERFIRTSPADWQMAQDIFETAIEFWKKQKRPFYLLLRASKPDAKPDFSK